jgi:hypothetical protein
MDPGTQESPTVGKITLILATFVVVVFAGNAESIAQPGKPIRLTTVQADFLKQNCVGCHSGDDAESGLRLDSEAVTLGDAEIRRRWSFLYDRVQRGEMPPKSADQPAEAARQAFLKSLGDVLTKADQASREVVLRRLNRREYTNTVSDLFGVHVDVSRILVDDSTETGFDNVGSRLTVSGEQMQLYLEAADLVLDQAFGFERRRGMGINKTVNLADLKRAAGNADRKHDDGVVLFSGAKQIPLYDLSMRGVGLYRIRVKARAEQSKTPVVLQVTGGNTGTIAAHHVGFFEVPPGELTTIEFTDRAVEPTDNLGFAHSGGYPYYKVNEDYTGPGIFIGEVSIEGPIDEVTPAKKRLFGNVDAARGTLKDVESILMRILPQAFRRPVTKVEAAPYLAFAREAIADGAPFEKALRLSLKGMLCAPEFLYLEEPFDGEASSLASSTISDHALATRLSYFLWSSLPDAELTRLADRGELNNPEVLTAQVRRMLADPKSRRFVEDFAGQWLRVRDIDFTVPERRLYPEYNQLLREAMIGETYGFFREVLDKDLSVQNFVDSDFLMLNQPLAEFYGIDGVQGLAIRRVPRPPGSVRGGVLTQASVLKVSADGTRTSPVLRGVWILNHLFGNPPPPPPVNVAAVEPDVRGASTIREVLARHRADPSCSRCHNRIDPPGFALESFDVLGAHRDWYRTRGEGGRYVKKKLHPFAPTSVQYQQGPDVDPSGTTPDGRAFADVREYKKLLLADETAMARGLTRLLLSYSIGRDLGFSDRAEVERIVGETQATHYGLRSIIEAVVTSETFRSP